MSKIVVPGEILASELEFEKGKNVFVDDESNLKAEILGASSFDNEEIKVSVKSLKAQERIRRNDFVLASVLIVKEKMVIHGRAVLPVAEVSTDFIDDLKTQYKIGDVIRAKVVEVTPFQIKISTKDKDLGVIKSRCTKCKTHLNLFNNNLKCISCGSNEERKVSSEYGNA